MSCARVSEPIQIHVSVSETGTTFFYPLGEAVPATFDAVTFTIDARAADVVGGTTGVLRIKPALQGFAVRLERPDDWQAFGSSWVEDDNQACYKDVDVTTVTDSSFFARPGIAVELTGDRDSGQADVTVQWAYKSCGRVIAGGTMTLTTDSTTDAFVALGDPVPTAGASTMKVAMSVDSLSGSARWKATARKSPVSTRAFSGWETSLEASYHTSAGDANTGELTPDATGAMWVQPGIQFSKSGGGLAQFTITAFVIARD